MKTKVKIDNKWRIKQGLDPIHPAETTAEFSLGELSDEERNWVARHYNDEDGSIHLNLRGQRLLIASGTEDRDVVLAIRSQITAAEKRKKFDPIDQESSDRFSPRPSTPHLKDEI